MKTNVVWKSDMQFDGTVGDHVIHMDAKAPIGKDTAPTPKELVAMGLGGCTAMDVIAFLKKHKQAPQILHVEVDIESSTGGYPAVFTKATVTFIAEGTVDPEKLNEAAHLSQTKYCGVSAMLSKSFPIEYRVVLNGKEIGSGAANFESH
jgi:putative redox protein